MSKISVIIPAYNQAQYLGRAIQSVLDQSYQDLEIVVVDDGSTDETKKVTQAFSDHRIHYVYQSNRGLSGARNTGIRLSHGEYITYLDSDDCFLPDKLRLLFGAFQADPNLGMVAGQAIPIDEHDRPYGRKFDTPLPSNAQELLLGNPLHVGSVLLLREWQEKAGFFDESLRSYEDWDMWLRLGLLGCPMGWVPEPVSLYRFHTAQMTRIGKQMTTATFAVLDKLFNNEELPESWLVLKDLAYSQAYFRAMAQSYLATDFKAAQSHLKEAVQLNPTLLENDAAPLARRLAALANSPKNIDPLAFLETIYHNLPAEMEVVQRRTQRDLGQAAVEFAFEAYQKGETKKARNYIFRAIRYQPARLANRGVLSILIRTLLSPAMPLRAS